VLTWTTGFPSCLKYLNGSFSHDKNSFNGLELIKNKNVELVIHINSLSMNKLKLDAKLTNIVIGHPNSKFSSMPDIFIPIGIPGIDYKGIMFRTDNVVSVNLKKIRDIK
jgi:formylmethanofuran dehydrogenase subunit B